MKLSETIGKKCVLLEDVEILRFHDDGEFDREGWKEFCRCHGIDNEFVKFYDDNEEKATYYYIPRGARIFLTENGEIVIIGVDYFYEPILKSIEEIEVEEK